MTPELIHCVYVSAATRNFDLEEFAQLLQAARENNARLDLTGMLLHAEGTFFQVLEGPPDVVEALYDKIERDPRHDQVTLIIKEAIAERQFDNWTMGFHNISRKELGGIPGINDFFGKDRAIVSVDAGRARKLLAAFREGSWRKKLTGDRRKSPV
jgi:hypothetical protein